MGTPGVDFNQVVVALSEPMKVKQVVVMGHRRFVILCELTRAEYDEKRRHNALIRKRFGRRFEDHTGLVTGEDPAHLDPSTMTTHPPDPPSECKYFYSVREL